METILPPKLHKGDAAGIISVSMNLRSRAEKIERAQVRFGELLNLKIFPGKYLFAEHHYNGGTTEQRLVDFHAMVTNPAIKVIVMAYGGQTAIDLLLGLDYDLIAQNPKIIAGISDATTVCNAITAKTGLVTYLGLELADFADKDVPYHLGTLESAWFDGMYRSISPNSRWRDLGGEISSYNGWQTIVPGQVEGRLVGGTLQKFLQLVNTPYAPNLAGSIMLIEGYYQTKEKIHAMLRQLEVRGALEQLGGIIVGYFVGSDDLNTFGNEQPLEETIGEIVAPYNIPTLRIGEFGHRVENAIMPIGVMVKMDATNHSIQITGPVVSS